MPLEAIMQWSRERGPAGYCWHHYWDMMRLILKAQDTWSLDSMISGVPQYYWVMVPSGKQGGKLGMGERRNSLA